MFCNPVIHEQKEITAPCFQAERLFLLFRGSNRHRCFPASVISHFPGFVNPFCKKALTNPVFSGIIKALRNFRNQGNTRRQGFIRFAVKTQGRESVGTPQFCRVRALPAGGGCFLLHRRSEFLFLPPILSEGGDDMGYITLADLLQFSAFVLSLITTILAILSFINKKK